MTTLANLLTRWRNKLDDNLVPYAWSDAELTEYANKAIEEICTECLVIEDSITVSINLVTDQATYSTSDKILRIISGRCSAGDRNALDVRDVEWMDSNIYGWRAMTSGEPRVIIDEGLGDNTIGLYPPPDATWAAGTLDLTINRLPITELDATSTSGEPEIKQKYQRYIDNGVYREAYSKHDEDTEAARLRDEFGAKFEKDKSDIKWEFIREHFKNRAVQPNLAFM